MAVEYRLTLAGDIPAEQVAECAVPDPAERPVPTGFGETRGARLYDRYGFSLSVTPGRNGYYDARDDDGSRWEWEINAYVDLDISVSKNDDRITEGTSNMLALVGRVLACRPEDAALVLNGDVLLLTRVDGVLRKHHRTTWWNHYSFANQVIPD